MITALRNASREHRWICPSCFNQLHRYQKLQKRSITSTVKQPSSFRRLPVQPARTRFAPSPTGYLHLGSLRTALFNYLLAKATGGHFVLRIEDTDKKRTVADGFDRILADLQWAGIEWDEGPVIGGPYGPYIQSERVEIYKQHVDDLLKTEHSYRCFCSSEKLKSISEQRRKLGLPADYDRSCAGIPKDESDVRAANGEPYVVRLKSRPKYPSFRDLVVGTVKPSPATKYRDGLPSYDDPILFKSDGMPTYHFANVVDDHLMKITHVVRASEWISSTSKHIHIYEAFGWQPPEFAHVSILTDTSRQKLSKRNLEASNMNWFIDGYRDSGVLPAALVNFVSLLGWSHDKKKDMMSMKELIENFDLRFTKGDTIVTFPKLWYLQGQHSARMAEEGGEDFERFVDQVYTSARQHPIMVEGIKSMGIARPRDYLGSILRIDAPNYTTSEQFLQRNAYFFRPPSHLSPYRSQADEYSHAVSTLVAKAAELSVIPESDWTEKQIAVALNKIMKDVTGATNEAIARDGSGKLKEARRTWNTAFYRYLRWAITGELVGPPIPQIMEALGYTVCMQRLDRGAEMVKSTSENGKIGTQLESKVQA